VLWQHIVLCNSTLLGMRLAMVCVVCYVVKVFHYASGYGVRRVLRSESLSLRNTLLIIQWNYFVNVFKMTLARNNVAT